MEARRNLNRNRPEWVLYGSLRYTLAPTILRAGGLVSIY